MALAATVVVVAGVVVAVTVGFGGARGATPAASSPSATATVTRQTLNDTETFGGTLGYGETSTLNSQLAGTVTWLPEPGTVVRRNQRLFDVDDDPVILLTGSLPAYRPMSIGTKGLDVKQLEENLKALGYSGFVVDRTFTAGTAAAVKAWQEDHGIQPTGRVDLGRVVFSPGAVRVEAVSAALGQTLTVGQAVLELTGTTRVVTLSLDVADQRLAKKGSAVTVELPDGTRLKGQVVAVTTQIEPAENPDDEDKTTLAVTVSLTDAAAGKDLDVATVEVEFTAAQHRDVLTVPVAALVALASGGYGVEVVDGSGSDYVAVTTGLFADGRVEISGDGIAEGAKVGVPR